MGSRLGAMLVFCALGWACTARSTNLVPTGDVPIGDDIVLPDGALPDVVFPDGAIPDVVIPDAGPSCTSAAQCADSVECTDDACTGGVCVHTPVPSRCPGGAVCDRVMGCRAARVCAGDGECVDTDPCTRNERCDPAQRVCVSDPLDGDGDGEPPRACGGTDCNDNDRMVNAAQSERCNGADDNCNGVVDEAPAGSECGAGATCTGGRCACPSGQMACSGRCVDTSADPLNCGACGTSCGAGGSCAAGRCACATGQAFCGGRCIDVQSNASNCGACGTVCATGQSCIAGACSATCSGLTVVDLARAGSVTGTTLRYSGDTTSAWTAQNPGGTASSSSPITPPSTCAPGRGLVVHRYTVGSAPASLRVSTHNAGTTTNFDTVLWVTTSCARTLSTAVCNDDDQTVPSDMTYASTVLTGVLPASTTVFIVVAGYYPTPAGGGLTDRGRYELSVEERAAIATGGACAVDGSTGVCTTGASCVGDAPNSVMGTCRLAGTAAGTPCRSGSPTCDTGLVCESQPASTGAIQVCARQGAAGAACDLAIVPAFRTCAAGLECYNPVFGSRQGSCVTAGSRVRTACRPAGSSTGRCDTGLTCNADLDATVVAPTCRRSVALGAACSQSDSVCAAGSYCVSDVPGSDLGVCRADGTAAGAHCRASGSRCDAGLDCTTLNVGGGSSADFCARTSPSGGACAIDVFSFCTGDDPCYFTDLTNRNTGRCASSGVQGGACNLSGPACSGALMCSVATPSDANPGLCQTVSAEGGSCERPLSRCAAGLTCVLGDTSDTVGVCRHDGAAGAACRATGSACDSGLTCNGVPGGVNACQGDRALGATCDPMRGTTRCASGAVCRATSYRAGTCATPTGAETEPNDAPGSSLPRIASSTALTAALPRGDIDCVAVTVASGGAVLAQVSDGQGMCPLRNGGGFVLDLYGTDAATLIGSTNLSGPGSCATIDGGRRGVYDWASGLAAGTYYVCARGAVTATVTTGAVDRYVFTAAPLPPR